MVSAVEQILDNCDYLRKTANISKSEFEKLAEVSVGYFSRLEKLKGSVGKSGREAQVSLPVAMNICKQFGVSLDVLVYVPLKELDGTQMYLIKFLDKLTRRTRDKKITWSIASEPEFKYTGVIKSKEGPIFVSKTFGERTVIAGKCYKVVLPKNVTAYFAKFSDSDKPSKQAVELWLSVNDKREYLCGTEDSAAMAHMVETLYNEVDLIMQRPLLSEDVKNAIEDFLKDEE